MIFQAAEVELDNAGVTHHLHYAPYLDYRPLADDEPAVDGDLFALGNTVDLRGPVGDSTRTVGERVTVDTAIEGDLLAAANQIIVTDNARIAGSVAAAGRRVEIDGTVENGARVAAGEIVIRGTVHGDANVIADRLDLAPGARITGDLDYRTRTPLSPEAAALVEGAVRYEAPPVDEADGSGTAWGVVFWFWQTLRCEGLRGVGKDGCPSS